MGPEEIIRLLGLGPHPEGGYYRETWRALDGSGTAIYFLLGAGDRSRWHRLRYSEVWHVYAGGALELTTWDGDARTQVTTTVLGPDLGAGQQPQAVVAAATWQTARPLGPWVLAGCTVCPAFEFRDFELAPPDWEPTPTPPSSPGFSSTNPHQV